MEKSGDSIVVHLLACVLFLVLMATSIAVLSLPVLASLALMNWLGL